MKYRWSRFNLEIADAADTITVFNTKSGAICDLERDIVDKYRNASVIHKEMPFFRELVELEFVETNDARVSDIADENILRIVLSCTEGCNLRCYYCFEGTHPHTCFFENDRPKDFLLLLQHLIMTVKYSGLSIIWFGGEPLLYMNKIEEISKEILAMCDLYHIDYESSVVTNATLLSAELIESLSVSRISSIQITFDGGCDKFVENKRGCHDQWERIISYLPPLAQKLHITFRFNIDKNNIPSIKDLMVQLMNLGVLENSKITFGHIKVDPESIYAGRCLSYEEFCNAKLEILSFIINDLDVDNETLLEELDRCDCACALVKKHALVIDSQGYCYKCEDKIGNPEKESLSNSLALCIEKALLDDTNMNTKCNQCVIYPICMGGCQRHWDHSDCDHKIAYVKKLALLKIGRY